KDAPDDPRVAAVGGSYGGGFSLMLAGDDSRVDAIVPSITWNNLANAFLPDSVAGGSAAAGVWKKAWAGLFFGDSGTSAGGTPQCGRFATDVCHTYLDVASTGKATPAEIALLERSSSASIISRIKAPTLLIQGEADTLFPLSEADANERGIAANGTPVSVAWFTGGHDGGAGPATDQDRLQSLTDHWLDFYLKHTGPKPSTAFTYSRIAGLDANSNGLVASAFSVPAYPGTGGRADTGVTVAGAPQTIANPPSSSPAALSSLPGTGGGLASFVQGVVSEVPGQHADFYSRPLTKAVDVVGSPTVQIRVASPTGSAVVFVKLYDSDPGSGNTLPDGLIAPVRLTGLPPSIDAATPVTVTLPAIVHQFAAGHLIRITVATSDQAFLTPAAPTVYTVALANGGVQLPTVASTPIASSDHTWWWALAGLAAALALGIAALIVVARRRRRHRVLRVVPEFADTPLVVRGLRKEYGDFVAVSKLDMSVQRGQVLGLLGPNGAGKTTTLRVLMGLTQPTAGEIYVYGHRLLPGSPVLSRLGALVEGPGFLPHLSGRDNLRLYWRSTGRPEPDARMDEALEIAGLGGAIDRRVKTYSHGMKQRLAIAQAMLGLPELLVLDEPTDGLDPPQIAEMRRVLRRYATDGRAVLVSSHLLAEVEQACTHVLVMHKGEKVADGPVDDIVGESPSVQFEVSDVAAATAVLDTIDGIRSVAPDGTGLVVDADGVARADLVAALVNAGVGVDRVAPRRRLEDAFLALVGGDTKASGERS
ncbi:MAG TPA: ATP-binding cassette domain-containing protein, partial [Micromonosporaceae bacterium]